MVERVQKGDVYSRRRQNNLLEIPLRKRKGFLVTATLVLVGDAKDLCEDIKGGCAVERFV